jgi:hypothetical protein
VAKAPPSIDYRTKLLVATSFPVVAIGLLNGFWLEALYRASPTAFWTADVTHFVVLPAIGLVVLASAGSIWPRDYGFRSLDRELSPFAVAGLFAFVTFLYWLFYNPVRDLAAGFLPASQGFWYGQVLPTWGLYKLLTIVFLSLTAAFVEEAVFRSLPWLYLSLRFPTPRFVGPYVAVTSVVFAAIHWEQGAPGVIAAFTLGVMAAVLYSKLQNVWPFVFAHFVTDLGVFS